MENSNQSEVREDGIASFYAPSRLHWRNWLRNNCENAKGIWLIIYHKKSGVPSVHYDEAVDEALCFGWVDSKPNKRDGQSYYQYFSKRNARSNWSKINKEKVERLIKAQRMAAPGVKMVEQARQSGTWNALDEVENLVIPADLRSALSKYDHALEHFENFPRSVKRGILEWIFNAKRPETRKKRIDETSRLADQNVRANQYRK